MVDTYVFVCRVQAGHYSQSKDLAEKAMKMEMEELGARPDRMAELHFLLGYVQDEVTMFLLLVCAIRHHLYI